MLPFDDLNKSRKAGIFLWARMCVFASASLLGVGKPEHNENVTKQKVIKKYIYWGKKNDPHPLNVTENFCEWVSKQVNWCFMPSQPVWLYQGEFCE